MNLLIFGATGGTGRSLVEQALARGHAVTAFVRDPAKLAITNDRLRIVQGDMNDPAAVDAAVPGHDAVLSALGIRNSKPSTELSDATRTIVAAMERHSVQRLIVVTSFACNGSRRQLKMLLMKVLIATVLKHIWADKDRQEQVVMDSRLDWIILRPGGLTDAPATGRMIAVDETADLPKRAMIPRADVAAFALDNLTASEWLRRPVSLCAQT